MPYMLYEIETGRALSQSSHEPKKPPAGTATKQVDDFNGSWNPKTLTFDPIPEVKRMSTTEFMELFTESELIGILDASKVSTQVELFVLKMEQAEFIDLNKQTVIDSINAIAAAGLITTERATVILNG